MKVWFLVLSTIVVLMTLLYMVRTKEGFEQIEYANRQKTYFHDKSEKGILTNPGLNLSDLNSSLYSTDFYLPVSKDRDYTTYFVEDPENEFKRRDNTFCSGARMPKDLPTRARGSTVGCGWYFHPTKASKGTLGTRTAPIFRNELAGGGRWIWNIDEAQKQEEIKHCKRLRDCSLLQLDAYRNVCGFCKEKGYGVPILSNGTQKYPEDAQGSCGESVIRSPNDCIDESDIMNAQDGGAGCMNLGRPSADNSIRLYTKAECDTLGGKYNPNGECLKQTGGSFSYECRGLNVAQVLATTQVKSVCDPNPNGALTRDCLLRIAKSSGFNESGAIMRLLKTNKPPNSTDMLALQTMKSVGIDIPNSVLSTGATDVNTVATLYRRIYDMTRTAPTKIARQSALWLSIGTKEIDACDLDGTSSGPFPVQCLQQAFRTAGCQPAGAKYPSERVSVSETASMTWDQVNAMFRKTHDSMKSNDPVQQNIALKNCLGNGTNFYTKPTSCYIKTNDGYDEADRNQNRCFSGLTEEEAKEKCESMPQCRSFSFTTNVGPGGRGSGCFKMGFNGRFIKTPNHIGFTKADKYIPPVACQPQPQRPGFDRPGNDYTASFANNAKACENLCCDEDKCTAWTHVPFSPVNWLGCRRGQPCCFRKVGSPAYKLAPQHRGIVSGHINKPR